MSDSKDIGGWFSRFMTTPGMLDAGFYANLTAWCEAECERNEAAAAERKQLTPEEAQALIERAVAAIEQLTARDKPLTEPMRKRHTTLLTRALAVATGSLAESLRSVLLMLPEL
jgi:hypothetical protein